MKEFEGFRDIVCGYGIFGIKEVQEMTETDFNERVNVSKRDIRTCNYCIAVLY